MIMHNKNLLYFFSIIILILFVQMDLTANTETSIEIQLRLSSVTDEKNLSTEEQEYEKQRSPISRFLITEQRRITESPLSQRDPELTPQQIVVMACDAKEKEINRFYISDPCVIRAKTFDENGALISSELFYKKSVDFSIVIPDDPNINLIKFYKPNWTGKEFVIELIGETQTLQFS